MVISNKLLHDNGFQSYRDEDEGWFEHSGLKLVHDVDSNNWLFAEDHEGERFHTFEDLKRVYKRLKGKDFEAGPPIEREWITRY